MSLLERYERQATILPLRNAGAHEDLVAQAVDEHRTWKQIERNIELGGDPTALLGFAGLEVTPPITNETLVTGGATELAIFPSARCAIATPTRAPVLYRLFASGTSTTAATPGTYTMAARLGNANSSPLFGLASGALTPVASATAAQWRLFGVVYVRVGGAAGSGVGSFEMNHSGTTGGGGPVSATGNAVFGGILASTDFTLTTNGLWMGATHATSTTNTWTAQLVAWASWS